MPQPKKIEWIVVMNSASAHVLADAEGHALVFELESPHARPRDRDRDRAGRSFAIGSPGRRAAMAPHGDPSHVQELAFARDLSDRLERSLGEGEFDTLVLVAPPRMLGAMREAMPDSLAARVNREIRSNLASLSPNQFREKLQEALKVT
ncbi:hypothetical protein B6V72_02915 [Thioclava sp. F34-6]|uniref:host attachment protein n=1 Tax=Thioclava sp. F34-6 TaxID=1973003 RepID=UPI000B5467F3|nr:host attachment protein [Thioclava sp. F34-6]OWY15547.1 hypothetical protein B6V72_02915 [Thioclava sp. F34-6]